MSNLVSSWNSEKPVAGNIAPEEALASLLSFETRFRNAESEYNTVAKAKEALDLHQSPPNPVLPLLDELQDFKSVWTALSKIWESLQDLRDTLWTSVVPRKVTTKSGRIGSNYQGYAKSYATIFCIRIRARSVAEVDQNQSVAV